jgi:hypothetical protein
LTGKDREARRPLARLWRIAGFPGCVCIAMVGELNRRLAARV